jgi:hypothetical protein
MSDPPLLRTLLAVIVALMVAAPASGQEGGEPRLPTELWEEYPLDPTATEKGGQAPAPPPPPQREPTATTRADPTSTEPDRAQDRQEQPRTDRGERWFLPLAVVVGLLLLGAAVALIRAMDRLRLDPLQRPRAAERRLYVRRFPHRHGPTASENISRSLEEGLMAYGHTPQRQRVDDRLAPEPEDAAGRALIEAAQPQFEHAIEAGVQNARQRAEILSKETEDAERLMGPREPRTLYRVATIIELAQHADVLAEDVLRVVNGDPVSSAVAERVRRAIDELGPPYPGAALESGPVQETLDRTRRQLLETLAETAAEPEARLPEGVGSLIYEALRVEVGPVSTQLGQVAKLVDALIEHVRQTEREIQRERKERLNDVALMTELITTGWRTVDRRLGRIERMLEDFRSADGGD